MEESEMLRGEKVKSLLSAGAPSEDRDAKAVAPAAAKFTLRPRGTEFAVDLDLVFLPFRRNI